MGIKESILSFVVLVLSLSFAGIAIAKFMQLISNASNTDELKKLKFEAYKLLVEKNRLLAERENLLRKWNEIVRIVNDKGGREFLDRGVIPSRYAKTQEQFTQDELRSLLQLVHPDKHCGKQSAVNLTKKINDLRNKA